MRVVTFDTETTGTWKIDRIITLAASSFDLGASGPLATREWRFNPGMPIPSEAKAVHGITDDDVKDWPPMTTLTLAGIMEFLHSGDVVCGHNVRFDLDMVKQECKRVGVEFVKPRAIDTMKLWRHLHPSSLESVYARLYEGGTFDSHDAAEDVAATEAVLRALFQRDEFFRGDLGRLLEAGEIRPKPEYIDNDGFFQWRDGVACAARGKYQGLPMHQIPRNFYDWMLNKGDFEMGTRELALAALNGDFPEIKAEVVEA